MRALTGQHRFQPIYWLMAFCLLLPVLTVGVPAFAFSTVPITSTTPAGITDNFQGNTLSPFSHWTAPALAQTAVRRNVVAMVSARQVGRYWNESD